MANESTIPGVPAGQLPSFESLYGEEGKFPVDPDTVARLRREAEEQGLIFSGDATAGQKLSEFIRNAPDAAYSFLARGAEGTAELAAGLALLTYKGGRLATETDPEKLKEIMAEPSFTKYLGEFRGALGDLNLGENRISGLSLEDIADTLGYYTAPVPTGIFAAGARGVALPIAKGAKQAADDVKNVLTKGDSGFRASAGPSKETLENPFFGSFYPKETTTSVKNPLGEVKKASEIPYETVDDQLKLISKKKDRQDVLRDIKKSRVENFKRDDRFGLFKRQQLAAPKSEIERLSQNPKVKKIFKENKNQLIRGHALEPSAASVIPEVKGIKDFSIYEVIPKKLLEKVVLTKASDVRRPLFFTTEKGNKIHETLGKSLIKDLVEKYRVQGYVFKPNKKTKGGEWVFDEKIIPENQIEKIKELNKSINAKEKKLTDLKLQTMFYDPAKDRLVYFGSSPTSLADLRKTMIERGFNKGGIVSIEEMTRPINAQR
jgi:hypothetical protein